MKKIFKSVAIITLSIFAVSCSSDSSNDPQPQTIADIAIAGADFSTLERALVRTNLVATLDGTGSFTVFAPTNEAFATFFASISTPGNTITVENVRLEDLKAILLNHVIADEITFAEVPAAGYATTLSPFSSATNSPGISMFLQKAGTTITINGGIDSKGATTTQATADIDASNGVIHVVNRVIQLPNVVDHAIANPSFTSLVAALTRNGNTTNFAGILSGTVSSPFTVFAPTNAAFTAALTELMYMNLGAIPEPALDKILKYHVIAGANVRAASLPSTPVDQPTFLGQTFKIGTSGGAKITDFNLRVSNIIATDVQCTNGVVHVLDKVLLPDLN